MDVYGIVGSSRPDVSFVGEPSSFAGGPHVESSRINGENGHHVKKVHPPIHLPPPPPPIKVGKTPVVNIILGVASSKFFLQAVTPDIYCIL